MKYSLRSLMIAVLVGPPLLACAVALFRDYPETTIPIAGFGTIGFALYLWLVFEDGFFERP
jgi:hypothetical protein